jgi:hypothetical protein
MGNPTRPDQVISLPKGGGALQGLGETFSPDLFTGTGNLSVPIAIGDLTIPQPPPPPPPPVTEKRDEPLRRTLRQVYLRIVTESDIRARAGKPEDNVLEGGHWDRVLTFTGTVAPDATDPGPDIETRGRLPQHLPAKGIISEIKDLLTGEEEEEYVEIKVVDTPYGRRIDREREFDFPDFQYNALEKAREMIRNPRTIDVK